MADYIGSGRFDSSIEHDRKYTNRKIGFENVDRATKFLPSLGFIGGMPGIGKSDFVIQLSMHIGLVRAASRTAVEGGSVENILASALSS